MTSLRKQSAIRTADSPNKVLGPMKRSRKLCNQLSGSAYNTGAQFLNHVSGYQLLHKLLTNTDFIYGLLNKYVAAQLIQRRATERLMDNKLERT
jgi:hypothetical protein